MVQLFCRCPILPGTKPLTESGDLARKMVDGMHVYLDRELAGAAKNAKQLWKAETSSPAAYRKSVEPNRSRLSKMLGTFDQRLPPRLEHVGGPGAPALVAETQGYKVLAVRWSVLPGVDGEGLLLEPSGPAVADVVAIPDADSDAGADRRTDAGRAGGGRSSLAGWPRTAAGCSCQS